MTNEKRAPVQGDGGNYLAHVSCWKERFGRAMPPGTIAWSEHLEAWESYAKQYGRYQSAERMAERGGFGYGELLEFLGRAPTTWRVHSQFAGHVNANRLRQPGEPADGDFP